MAGLGAQPLIEHRRPDRNPPVLQDLTPEEGWRKIYDQTAGPVIYSPHYVSYQWAVYLWGYHVSGFAPLLERAQTALAIMMKVRSGLPPRTTHRTVSPAKHPPHPPPQSVVMDSMNNASAL